MSNYKEMYLYMLRESEKAIRILIQAQQTCEEMYLADGENKEPIPIAQLIKAPNGSGK